MKEGIWHVANLLEIVESLGNVINNFDLAGEQFTRDELDAMERKLDLAKAYLARGGERVVKLEKNQKIGEILP